MGLPRDTLRTTTCSYYILLTLYNLTLTKYSRTLVEYSRTLCVVIDGILSHIAAYYPHIAIVGKTWQNMAEYGRRYALALLCVLYAI